MTKEDILNHITEEVKKNNWNITSEIDIRKKFTNDSLELLKELVEEEKLVTRDGLNCQLYCLPEEVFENLKNA